MGVNGSSGKVFGWFANMTAVAGLMTWFGICVTYLRFYAGLKAQGFDRRDLPYATVLQPYAAWYGLIFCLVVCFVSTSYICIQASRLTILQFSGWAVFLDGNWDQATFVTNYFPLMLFPVLYIGAKILYRQPWKKASEMDFITDIDQIEADT